MKIENLNLTELNAKELKEIEGGILDKIKAGAELSIAVIGALYGVGYVIGRTWKHIEN
jgi:hypothetical protein